MMRNAIYTLLLIWTLGGGPVHATSFVEVPFEDSVGDSPIVVRGTVLGRRADWGRGSDGRDRIYTYFELSVKERLKGASGQGGQILVRELGGEVGGVGMQVSGTAQFKDGEDVVVFLNAPVEDSKGRISYDVRGMMMGKYSVVRDANGEEILEGAEESALEHPFERDVRHHVEAQGDTQPRAKWTLGRLRGLIAQQGGGANQVSAPVQVLTPVPARADTASPLQSSMPGEEASSPDALATAERRGWIFAFGLGLGSLLFLVRRYFNRR